MIVRELITKLGFSLDMSQLHNAEKGVDRVRDSAERAASTFRNIATALASFVTAKAIIGIGDEMQNLRIRMGMIPQTVGDVAAAFDDVAAHSTAAGIKIGAYISFYTRLGHASKKYVNSQEELLQITDTISKALLVNGATAQESASVMLQLSQALGAGVLQSEEFNSIAEAAPTFMNELAEAMNIPREQLKKMGSEGKLTSKAVIEATLKLSKVFNERFAKLPMTVGRALTVVGNRFSLMIDKMNRESLFITALANKIIAAFDMIESGVMKVAKSFDGWNNMLRFVGISIGVAFGAKAIAVMVALGAFSWVVILPFIKMAAVIGLVSLVLEDLYVWWTGTGDSVTEEIVGWIQSSEILYGVIGSVVAILGMLGTAVYAVGGLIISAFTLDYNTFASILRDLGGFFEDAAKWWGSLIFDALKGAIVGAIKGGLGVGGAIGSFLGMTPSASVTPSSISQSSSGMVQRNVNNNTSVTVTVPPGTTAEQAKFLQGAAQESFNKARDNKLARDMAVYAP
jgi:tape measure domain-containing protein